MKKGQSKPVLQTERADRFPHKKIELAFVRFSSSSANVRSKVIRKTRKALITESQSQLFFLQVFFIHSEFLVFFFLISIRLSFFVSVCFFRVTFSI